MKLREKLQACLDEAVRNGEAAGYNLLILRNGQELCYVESGLADVAGERKISRDSIFRLYSQIYPALKDVFHGR